MFISFVAIGRYSVLIVMVFSIDLGLLFENLVRDYRSFGIRAGGNWARITTEIVHWFAHQGMNLGFHVEQEYKRADLVWFRGADLKSENVVLHLESETLEQNAEQTIKLLVSSSAEVIVAVLHADDQKAAEHLLGVAKEKLADSNRRMLLVVDAVWKVGGTFFGWVLEPNQKPVSYVATGLKYRWRELEYWDMKSTERPSA